MTQTGEGLKTDRTILDVNDRLANKAKLAEAGDESARDYVEDVTLVMRGVAELRKRLFERREYTIDPEHPDVIPESVETVNWVIATMADIGLADPELLTAPQQQA